MSVLGGRLALVMIGALAVSSCDAGDAADERATTLMTGTVTRGDLVIQAEATGTVEPVREVEVKSKASGEILRLFIDIGDDVERGTLLAEIDPRDVRNRYNQTQADLAVAEAQHEIADAQLERQRRLLDAEVITQAEFENATLSFANAQAGLVRAQTNFELAELQMADVSIRAPMAGTIIQKNVEEGAVIQSASSNVSGGTTLFVMANLEEMQVRTLVDETDMGDLVPGLPSEVLVEAFPNRSFRGTIDKIEPQATVEQNVTMFPVIVSIDNRSGLLKPGMNAEVDMLIDQAVDVVLVPNNAIVQTSDVGPAAMALGLEVDDMDLRPFMRPARGEFAGRRGLGPGEAVAGGNPIAEPIQALGARLEAGEITEDSMRMAVQALRARGRGGRGFGRGGGAVPGEATPWAARPGAVFVLNSEGVPEPRLVQLGLGDWDNTQIVRGVEEGEILVIVGPAQLQAQQQEFLDRMRDRIGGVSLFGRGTAGPGGGRRR